MWLQGVSSPVLGEVHYKSGSHLAVVLVAAAQTASQRTIPNAEETMNRGLNVSMHRVL